MRKNILITGLPKSGKTTLLKKVISDIPFRVGFVTNEILEENKRVGFEVVTHLEHKAVLSHLDFKTPFKVARYFVNVQNLEPLITEVFNFGDEDILYLDEVGQMQLFSEKFKGLVLKFLNSQNTCIMTVSEIFEDSFIEDIKKRDDIILVEISVENRDGRTEFVRQLPRKIEKARNYINEPVRFVKQNDKIILNSEHGTRTLILQNEGQWSCDCDFFKQYAICSHSLATAELYKNSI